MNQADKFGWQKGNLEVIKSDKVLPPLEKALMDVIIEWND
jgi:hypothetical protein